ncbi:MAG: thymidylate synthase [Minisyncoccia bacterium]
MVGRVRPFTSTNQPRILMDPKYLPFEERKPDKQYLKLVRRIYNEGEVVVHPFQHGMGRKTHLFLPPLVYKLSNGFPLLTERNIPFWRVAIAELVAFMNGVTTNAGLHEFGCNWWDQWTTKDKCAVFDLEEGDLGWASYGGAYGKFPMPDGKSFNQFVNVVRSMQESPSMSTHCVTSWIPFGTLGHSELKRKVVVAPCHGNFLKFTIIDGKMTLQHVQRSADMPVGVVSNIIQYATLLLMAAQVVGVEPYQYVHYFLDAQIYENQLEQVKILLDRSPRAFPTLRIVDKSVKDILAFRPEHFELTDYNPFPGMKFPVTE